MIIVRAPLRISFFGGGSDIPQFYQNHGGATFSTAIDKYVYVCVNKNFDSSAIRLSYSKTEIVSNADELEHTRVRACLKKLGIKTGLEIVTIADIPSKGTGLGSSSSFTVALLKALYIFKGIERSPEEIAEEACEIEINELKEPIGKQDQYIASLGGLRYMQYGQDGRVLVRNVDLKEKLINELEGNLLLFYTGISRSAGSILGQQIDNYHQEDKIEKLKEMVILASEAKGKLENSSLDDFGQMLDRAWGLKKNLSSAISNSQIDYMYDVAKFNGAIGGKVLGAGGGGFLLVYAPKEAHNNIRTALAQYQELNFKLNQGGAEQVKIC